MSLITVIGSSNTDMIMQLDKIPFPGETLIGNQFSTAPGGKGANQAVAAARLGGNVNFISEADTSNTTGLRESPCTNVS